MKPKVTIIVTTKNRPDYLFRCLLAIKLQVFEDFECFIIGDECNYAEAVYFDAFVGDPRFNYFKISGHKIKNVGAIGKNVGIRLATTSLICYCNDDDILWHNHVQVLYDLIIKERKELVFAKFYHVDFGAASTYEILNRDIYFTLPDDRFPVQEMKYDTISMMHSKRLAIDTGMWRAWQEVGYNEDGDFIARLKEKVNNDFIISEKLTAVYCAHWKDEDTKEHDEYINGLRNLPQGQLYVYPDLVNNLKNKYAKVL